MILACPPGFTGDACEKPCAPSSYGEGCKYNCGSCWPCHHVYGCPLHPSMCRPFRVALDIDLEA